MSRVGRVAPAQMKKLLDLICEDGVLEDGRIIYKGTNKKNFWKRIATQLNNVSGGANKNTFQWCKVWADWKNNTKKKANVLLRRNKSKTEHTLRMTNLELRLLKMIKYPADCADTVRLQTLVDNANEADNTLGALQTMEFASGDYSELGDEKMTYNNQNTETEYCNVDNLSHFCSVVDGVQADNDIGECSSGTDRKDNVKINAKSYKRKKATTTQQDFKIKTAMALEQEKVQQRTEELRLRAVELKVKRDELKLKEMEMDKVNYLTTIEEEKLKCLRDISSCLKELLERNKSGNFRFPVM